MVCYCRGWSSWFVIVVVGYRDGGGGGECLGKNEKEKLKTFLQIKMNVLKI